MRSGVPIHWYDGHILLELGRYSALLDAGSRITVGRGPRVRELAKLMGAKIKPTDSFMRVTVKQTVSFVGHSIDVLLGADAVFNRCLHLSGSTDELALSSSLDAGYTVSGRVMSCMAVPVIEVDLDGQLIAGYFDTGAKVSYLPADIVHVYPQVGTHEDFYPGYGWFEMPIYEIPAIWLGELAPHLAGRLPDELAELLKMGGASDLGDATFQGLRRRAEHG